jgi:hypothetical protein
MRATAWIATSNRNPKIARDVSGWRTALQELSGRGDLAVRHASFPPAEPSQPPGGPQAGTGPLRDELTLHLGQARHHMKEESPSGDLRVDAVGQAPEVDLSLFELGHQVDQALAMLKHRSGEPLPDLLSRLDAAIATAKKTGNRVDEINSASSDTRYEF